MTGPRDRLFGLPPGADFPQLLVEGLLARHAEAPPEALARVELYVNTRRMARRIREILADRGARLLPRIRLVTDPAEAALPGVPPPVSALRRRLELMQLVARLTEADPTLAPRTAAFDLADSLADLLAEMQDEGVTAADLARLDIAGHAAHWQRSRAFLDVVGPFVADAAPDPAARLGLAVAALERAWQDAPPDHPVIVAGSTGSRGPTARLMAAVARLPRGALVLPGFDLDMPAEAWEALAVAREAQDHPQFRFLALLQRLDCTPAAVRPWVAAPPPCPARNRLVSLALRPAPVTDRWMAEGAALHDLAEATAGLTLLEAPTPRAEALAIALRLRQAAEEGRSAALITPDRTLSRQVTAALDRWRIRPDDSAGEPLNQSAPGRLLRQVAALRAGRVTVEALVALLKHPLVHSGAGRGDHLRHARDLELRLRRSGPAFPDGPALRAWGAERAPAWSAWLADWLDRLDGFDGVDGPGALLAEHVAHHRALAEALAGGAAGGAGALWQERAGEEALAAMDELAREADAGGAMTAEDYAALIDRHLAGREVREPAQPHPLIRIWGTLEARVQGAELVIAAGLNEGVWPELPAPDPWLNRRMRLDAGLLLPERRIGLAAHDFQQAACASEVVLSRALRDAEAATVPARWLNRLTNLLDGLTDGGGPQALCAMRARGAHWLTLAAALEAEPPQTPRAGRPSPRPPADARPRRLSVTEIETLIRDPYAVYAKHVLRLRPLDPLHPKPDALLRGTVLHRVVERFVAGRPADELHADARDRLMAVADAVLAEDVPWPAARRLWRARLAQCADWFLDLEARRDATTLALEASGEASLDALGFTLTAKADRIDRLPDGTVEILDYKTGTLPSTKEQAHFAKQLLLEAAMAERGGFAGLGPVGVGRVTYVGLSAAPKVQSTETSPEMIAETWADLGALIARYLSPAQGFTARRAPKKADHVGDYDHLARHGEWAQSDPPAPEDVGEAP